MNVFRLFCFRKPFPFICIALSIIVCSVILTCFTLLVIGIDNLTGKSCNKINSEPLPQSIKKENDNIRHFAVWIKSKTRHNSHLKHVVNAFKAYNYEILDLIDEEIPNKEWNVLWAHNYPFTELKSYLNEIKMTHCMNHFPGTGFITNKVFLAASGLESIPKAFRVPEDKSNILKFAQENPNVMFVQKSNNHRGIEIKTVKELNFDDKTSFIQQFIHNPILIDGHKFDIGVYTIITSSDPLRVYIFQEVLFRFCTEKYHPFKSNDSRKYVVGDDYLPTWQVPSLAHYYNKQKLGMRGSFDTWLRSQGKDPNKVWKQVEESIRKVFYFNEVNIINHSKPYKSTLKFFELMRFDFIIDENLEVYLMEANMSPNLSSAHFQQNRLLYEQVMFNLLSLAGLSYNYCSGQSSQQEREMKCTYKDVAVFPEHCSTNCITSKDCEKVACQLCHPCLSEDWYEKLCKAFLEHTWRASYRRVIPAILENEAANVPGDLEHLSHSNTLMSEWFRGKCLLDQTFCF